MTQRQEAKKGTLTKAMRTVAKEEALPPEEILSGVASGAIAIPFNPFHQHCRPIGIGKALRTKVNANIGTSADYPHLKSELKKLSVCLEAKTDTVMDLSTGGDLKKIRRKILAACPLPLGTVPIYQAMVEGKMTVDGMFSVVEEQAREGVDFMTIHCGVTSKSIKKLKGRLMGIVSRGGAMMARWMVKNGRENPFYEYYDRLLEVARKYDVTLSLGDGMRPGSVADAGDAAQIEELKILGKLTKIAWDAGVQVIIEGPGHVPLNQIEAQMRLQKKVCHGAPFYVLGPLPTDVAPGYDHITAAIGGALAAAAGADFLCYVTPTEHLGLPTPEDVREGIIVSRLAAHIADIAKGIKGAAKWDIAMSKARKALDWGKQIKLALDPDKAREIHEKRRRTKDEGRGTDETCSMCGDFCAMKISSEALN